MIKYINYLNNKKIKKDIKPLFLSAFPSEERPPADIFFKGFENDHNVLYGFYDEETFIGFASLVLYKDIAYIFFLAVSPSQRDKGYGSMILTLLKELYKDYVLLLCYEEVDEKYSDYQIRQKREQFYLRNGFISNDLKTNEFGVIFQTAYYGAHKVKFEDYVEIFVYGFGEFARKHINILFDE